MNTLVSVDFWSQMIFEYLNTGLASGLILGFLLLLSPVTNRLLAPRRRVWLWGAAWLGAYMPGWFVVLGWLKLLPMTLRDLITPRTREDVDSLPWFLPEYEWEGTYNLAFPGGGSVQVELNDAICLSVVVLYVVGFVLAACYMSRGEKRLDRQKSRGELLPVDHPLNVYANQEQGFVCDQNVDIYLCDDLPTSFVQYGKGRRKQVFLQKELPEQRLELVLKHEVNHFRLGHCWLKGIVTVALVIHWWNPIVWLAYFVACRDLELDCDERTIEELAPDQRREYARTLVELGVGKQLWDAPLCFGECDAAVRVRALTHWEPRKSWRMLVELLLTVLLLLFITGGPVDRVVLPADVVLEQQRHQEILLQTAPGSLVSDLIEYMREENAVESGGYIDQLWIAQEGGTHALCHMSDGSWQQVGIWVWNPSRDRCELYFGEITPILQPDLSRYHHVW